MSEEEIEKKKKESEKINAQEMESLRTIFFNQNQYWNALYIYFEESSQFALDYFEALPEVRRWKLSAVKDFDLGSYLCQLWMGNIDYYLLKKFLQNLGCEIKRDGPGLKFTLPDKDFPNPEAKKAFQDKYGLLYRLLILYGKKCDEIKKLLYQHGPSYKTFWLDRRYCMQLNEIFKGVVDERLKSFEQSGGVFYIRQFGMTNIVEGHLKVDASKVKEAEDKHKNGKFIAENAGARFVNDLEEIRKELWVDFGGYEYWNDIIKKGWRWIVGVFLGGIVISVVGRLGSEYLLGCLKEKSWSLIVCMGEWWPWLKWAIVFIGLAVVVAVIDFKRNYLFRKFKKRRAKAVVRKRRSLQATPPEGAPPSPTQADPRPSGPLPQQHPPNRRDAGGRNLAELPTEQPSLNRSERRRRKKRKKK